MADAPTLPSRDVARLRQVLARELETISEYEELARAAESPDIRAFFLHLAEEEKEHVAEAVSLLGRFDPGQKTQNAKDFSQAHFAGGASPSVVQDITTAQPTPSLTGPAPSVLTVSGGESKDGYLPAGHKLPSNPHHVIHALPAPPSPRAGSFSVGPLKGTRR